ncbi:hypothetical protein RP15_gb121 [Staphylococcus phage vB_Sau-RP15]|nr:hypothetical protein RP15_gb121 [Staphylococcus phage vB_Sau-RP15]
MDITVSELFEYILGHCNFGSGDWYTYDLGEGYCIKVNSGYCRSMYFIKGTRVVKEVLIDDKQLFKGFSNIYDFIDYYEEALDEKCRKERERLKEIRTFLGK